MASCMPSSFNIPGPSTRADGFHTAPETWELNTWHSPVRGYLGLAFRQGEVFH